MYDLICPLLFYIRIAKKDEETDKNDSDSFEILNYEELTYVQRLKTTIVTPLNIHLLCCHYFFGKAKNYCTIRKNEQAIKKICDKIPRLRFLHFHVYPGFSEDIDAANYLLAFIERSEYHANIDCLVEEMLEIIHWLNITNTQKIFYHICLFGNPVFRTSNIHYLDNLINTKKKKAFSNDTIDIECDTMEINRRSRDCLTISLEKRRLVFSDS
jgi:hypothetical protein